MPTITSDESDLEARLADLDARLRAVEGRDGERRPAARATGAFPPPPPAPRPPAPRPAPPAPVAAEPAPEAPPAAPARDLERLLGGRVLAWVGAVSMLAGLVLLFALGVSEGWIGPAARVGLGAAVAGALVGAGVWLHERRGRTEAAQAAAAAGFGGLFLADTVASRGYDLLAPELGLVLAAVIAIASAVTAVRWRSQVVGALGISGALLAPVLAGIPLSGPTALFVLVAACGATFVLLYERWTWLSFAVLIIPAVQWAPVLVRADWQAWGIVAVLAGFGVVNVVAALGTALRTGDLRVTTPSAYLLGLNAVLLGIVGSIALSHVGGREAAAAWLAALALAHVAAGVAVRGRARDLAFLAFALAALAANVALSVLELDPLVRTIVWVASAVAMAAVARSRRDVPDGLAACGLGGQLALATVSIVLEVRSGVGAGDGALVVGLAALAAGCLVSGRLTADREHWRMALDGAGLLAVFALSIASFSGVELTVAWAALAVTLARVARRSGDPLAVIAAVGYWVAALGWCVADQAPPTALLDGEVALGTAALGLGAVLGAAVALLRSLPLDRAEHGVLEAATAVAGLYLASIAVVAVAPSGEAAAGGTGQLALSAMWALVGVGTLVVGLRLRRRRVRVAALALLGLAAGKVFLFDLTTLTPMARVGSFLAVGLLLLVGAFAYQRLRPEPLEAATPPRT